MTSINALRFDEHRGILAVDEIRSWNPEDMKLNAADKGRCVIPPDVTEALGITGSYANTGTSSIGDELRLGIREEVGRRFYAHRERHGTDPAWTGEDMAEMVWDVMVGMKTTHTDQWLDGRFGISQEDLIRGYSLDGCGQKIELKDPKIIEKAFEAITWENKSAEVRPVYANIGIYAGYDPVRGFRIWQFNLMEQFAEPVDGCFFVSGSASDTTSRVLAEFSAGLPPRVRRGGLDPALGSLVLLAAINEAGRTNIGVGGYYNLHLFDGTRPPAERLREVNDHRAKLAAEIADAWQAGFLPRAEARNFVQEILFSDQPLARAFQSFQARIDMTPALQLHFRGYRG